MRKKEVSFSSRWIDLSKVGFVLVWRKWILNLKLTSRQKGSFGIASESPKRHVLDWGWWITSWCVEQVEWGIICPNMFGVKKKHISQNTKPNAVGCWIKKRWLKMYMSMSKTYILIKSMNLDYVSSGGMCGIWYQWWYNLCFLIRWWIIFNFPPWNLQMCL